MDSHPGSSSMTHLLVWGSWLSLGGAVLVAVSALFCQWGVNAELLGARDAGVAIFLAFVGAAALIGSAYAAPVLIVAGLLALVRQRRAAGRFLAAGAVSAIPAVVLTWLEHA